MSAWASPVPGPLAMALAMPQQDAPYLPSAGQSSPQRSQIRPPGFEIPEAQDRDYKLPLVHPAEDRDYKVHHGYGKPEIGRVKIQVGKKIIIFKNEARFMWQNLYVFLRCTVDPTRTSASPTTSTATSSRLGDTTTRSRPTPRRRRDTTKSH